MRSINIATALAAVLAAVPVLAQNPHHQIDPTLFPGITPNADLEWHDCYGVFKCARLIVPAKIKNPYKPKKPNGKCGQKTVELAIVKLPYVPAEGGPPHQGAVHVALGGWSSSNTNFLVRFGEDFAPLVVGYDMIAIDYRGWGWTTPSFKCFESEDERKAWVLSEPQLLGADSNALSVREDRAEQFAKKCNKNGGDVGRFMGTYAAAVDHYTVMKAENRTKMSFWGISSGAHLGQSIAELYPEAVDKFFFDSPAPSDLAYTVTTAKPSQIKDAERGLDAFFYTCLQAGPAGCPFVGNSTKIAQLRARYNAIDAKIKATPIPVPGSPKPHDWSGFHTFLSTALHGPGWWTVLANVLLEIEQSMQPGYIAYLVGNVLNQAPPPLPQMDESAAFDGILSGVCLDSTEQLENRNKFQNYLQNMMDAAPSVAPIFAEWRLVCQKWKIEPVNRFPGQLGPVATSGKIVIVNNVADPASSINGAKSVAARFSPSVLVKNNAAGHTTFGAQSNCLFGVMYTFFVLGVMPDQGTTCSDIFGPPFGVQLPANF